MFRSSQAQAHGAEVAPAAVAEAEEATAAEDKIKNTEKKSPCFLFRLLKSGNNDVHYDDDQSENDRNNAGSSGKDLVPSSCFGFDSPSLLGSFSDGTLVRLDREPAFSETPLAY